MPMQGVGGVGGHAVVAQEGKVITLYSAKGGVGCTTLATNLAFALHSEQSPVALVDCNLQFGDVAVFLNLKPQHSVIELFENSEALDSEFVSSVAIAHTAGFKVFMAPPSPEQADVVNAAQVKRTLEVLRTQFAYVIVDTPSALTDIVLSAFDVSDKIILVTTPDIPSIKDARMFFELIDALNYPPERVMFVLNRVDKRGGITASNIQESIKHEVTSQVPLEERVLFAINSGVPLISSSRNLPFAQAVVDVGNKLKASFMPQPEKEKEAATEDRAKKPAPRRLFGG